MTNSRKSSQGRVNENYVFIQAFQLFQQAVKAEKSNFIKALNLYKQSLAMIDSIPARFPSSELALKIAQRQFRLGKSSYAGIKKRIARLRAKAAREELLTILHDCALNIRSPELKAENLGEVAIAFWRNSQKEFALSIFSEAIDVIETIRQQSQKNNALSLLAVKYVEIEEYERALTLAVYFTEISDQIRLLTDLGLAFYEKKMREKARQLFNNAIELASREQDPEKRTAYYAWVAFKLAESREFFWALEVSEAIQESDTKIAIVHQVAERLIEFGKFATIHEIIKKIPDQNIKSELMANLVMRYSEDGYFSQAREFADAIEVPALKARAFLSMAKHYKGKKLLQVAFDLVEAAVKLLQNVTGIADKVLILTTAATLSYEFREERQACDFIRKALKEIEGLTSEIQRSEFLTYLVKICLENDQISQAQEIIGHIEDNASRAIAVGELCGKLSSLDRIEDALQLARKLADKNLRIKAFFNIVNNNPDNRNFRIKNELVDEIVTMAKEGCHDANTDRILAECALLVAGFEKFHQALQLLEHISDQQVRDELSWSLAEFKFKTDFFNEGIEIIRLIQNSDQRITRLIRIGLEILRGKYPDSSFKIEDFLPVAFSFWLEEKESSDRELQKTAAT
ncbi:MAG: hypothetical protein Kow0029_02080 [Candidatus Rifleibacteriota bacterium]